MSSNACLAKKNLLSLYVDASPQRYGANIIFISSFCDPSEFLALANINFYIWEMIKTSSAWENGIALLSASSIYQCSKATLVVFWQKTTKI
uniref:Uncharacterized protein n=1 Tax=Romanomermis culicivorax TaxID=13658 RepID=A0A915K8G1_ROMCU